MSGQRVLTVRQPWADLIMAGVKDVENRTWPVPSTLPQTGRCVECGRRAAPSDEEDEAYEQLGGLCSDRRGPYHVLVDDGPFPFRLGIHSSLAFDPRDVLAPIDPWAEHMRHFKGEPIDTYQRRKVRGALLGFVTVTGCHHADDDQAIVNLRNDMYGWDEWRDPHEGRCSRWAQHDVYHWTLTDPEPLDTPIPMRGHQGLWTLTEVPS